VSLTLFIAILSCWHVHHLRAYSFTLFIISSLYALQRSKRGGDFFWRGEAANEKKFKSGARQGREQKILPISVSRALTLDYFCSCRIHIIDIFKLKLLVNHYFQFCLLILCRQDRSVQTRNSCFQDFKFRQKV